MDNLVGGMEIICYKEGDHLVGEDHLVGGKEMINLYGSKGGNYLVGGMEIIWL